jgi:hypothetical protein
MAREGEPGPSEALRHALWRRGTSGAGVMMMMMMN